MNQDPAQLIGALVVGPMQFDRPALLLVAPAAWLLAWLMARRSLAGLGPGLKWTALGLRMGVIALIVGALAEPGLRRVSDDVAVIAILDQSQSVPTALQDRARQYLDESVEGARGEDRIGLVAVAADALVRWLPQRVREPLDPEMMDRRDGTDLSQAARLAMAITPEDAATRLLLISDGNETEGSLLATAQAAAAAGIPIDVLPLQYAHEGEVAVERLVAPANARMGQTADLRVVLEARSPARGRLNLTLNGQPLDLDPDEPGTGVIIELPAGTTVRSIPVVFSDGGAQQFEAVFEPLPDAQTGVVADAIEPNNRQLAVTFVQGEGRVLLVAQDPALAQPLAEALTRARIASEVREPAQGPSTLVELSDYDAVVLIDVPAFALTQQQQEDLLQYVRDLGGGLGMVGGENSFGQGGWLGTPVAEALPVRMDPPEKRQMPRGALAIIMHSCEMPNGNFWGRRAAEAVVEALTSQDLVGVLETTPMGGDHWIYEMGPVGDRGAVMRALQNLSFGDTQSFQNMFQMAFNGLQNAAAGQKHVIVVSDGDPTPPTQQLLSAYQQAGITVSTLLVFPHTGGPNGPEGQMLQMVARSTGGQFYAVTNNNQLNSIPNIMIKETITVRRSLVWEGDPFSPAPEMPTEPMRGVRFPLPGVTGYNVTADRPGLSQVGLRGPENDPILATWQFGVGRALAFTPDAGARWTRAWNAWPQQQAFWEQHLRWLMRPGGAADLRVTTEDLGQQTRVIVDALRPDGSTLDFVRFSARVSTPTGEGADLTMAQTAPGRYEGTFDSADSGTYLVGLRYAAPGEPGAPAREGTVQAAVTRPFADEFRALRDNRSLLEQVAQLTGGRVLGGAPGAPGSDLWSRENLTMPVSVSSIWPAAALLAAALFWLDAAVRRIRPDPAAIARALQRGFHSRAERSAADVGTLQQARQRAQQSIEAEASKRAVGGNGEGGRGGSGEEIRGAPASARFEASAEELARAEAQGQGPTDAVARPTADEPGPEEGGLSRLRQAKKRARDSLDEPGAGT